MKINKEELKEIEDIIKDSDYKKHYHLHTYFEVEHIDNLVRAYKKQKEIIDKVKKLIEQYGRYDGQKCTRGFQMWTADFNKLLEILEDKEV